MPRHPLIRVSTRGAGQRASALRGGKRVLQDELNTEIRELGDFAEVAFKDHAPRAPGDGQHGADTIRFVAFFRAARPQGTLVADFSRDGFDYLRSTRFGQATDPIVPRTASVLAVHLFGRLVPPIAMRHVNAYRPASDWVEDAARDVDHEVDRSTRSLGRRFERRILA